MQFMPILSLSYVFPYGFSVRWAFAAMEAWNPNQNVWRTVGRKPLRPCARQQISLVHWRQRLSGTFEAQKPWIRRRRRVLECKDVRISGQKTISENLGIHEF